MKLFLPLATPFLLSVLGVVSAAELPVEDHVVVLSGETIEQAIQDHSHLVVEFYAPCKSRRSVLSFAVGSML